VAALLDQLGVDFVGGREKDGRRSLERRAQMQRRLPCTVALIVGTLGLFAGGASASGPAAPGKDVIQLNCEGFGDVTVSVPRSERNNGAGQLVGGKGHGIGVSFTVTLTDVTTDTVLDSESSAVGRGHAHPHQATTTCSGVVFSAPASEFFEGGPLPPGVAPTDIIEASLSVEVIPKV
jgi:hypothetical protein